MAGLVIYLYIILALWFAFSGLLAWVAVVFLAGAFHVHAGFWATWAIIFLLGCVFGRR